MKLIKIINKENIIIIYLIFDNFKLDFSLKFFNKGIRFLSFEIIKISLTEKNWFVKGVKKTSG